MIPLGKYHEIDCIAAFINKNAIFVAINNPAAT
jgi:hypothetical protein